MGLFPDGTGTVAITDQRLLVKVPAGWSHTAAATTSVVFATAYYALIDLAAVQPGSGCSCTPPPVGSAWRPCSWPGTSVWKCSRPPAAASGTRCGPWALTTTTSPTPAAWNSRRSSARPPVAAVWMWCSTRCRAISSTLPCGWSHPAGSSWRWARPTSATPTSSPRPRRRALPRVRPLRGRTGAHRSSCSTSWQRCSATTCYDRCRSPGLTCGAPRRRCVT